ncbi:MAG TPA: hypothetical protein VGC41_12370 [Kofleriaceae bacterium]
MRLAAAFSLLACSAGCDRLFGLDGNLTVPVDAAVDGPPCTEAEPRDDFMFPLSTCSWGSVNSGSPVTVDQGGLTVRVTTARFGGCGVDNVVVPPTGLFVYVDTALSINNGYTTFKLYADDSDAVTASFTSSSGHLKITDADDGNQLGHIDTDGSRMWWRMRSTADGMVGEVSSDFRAWTPVGMVPGKVGTVRLEFGAGSSAPATSGAAVFRHLNVCPL